jgi:Gene product 88
VPEKPALTLSRDRKVSPLGRWQEKEQRWVPSIRNSFGLPSGKTCPGQTPWCRDICYGANAERGYTGVEGALQRNLDSLLEAGTTEGMAKLLTELVRTFSRAADRWQLPQADQVFRIHWDGDFFSLDYASAWAHTIRRYPGIAFWAYTRSFREPLNVVPLLAGIPNLALYLSADEHNIEDAVELVERYPDVYLARCGTDYGQARELSERPAVICPENDGRMALMNDGRGACVDCRLCVEGRGDVLFATKLPSARGRALPVIVDGVKRPKVIRHCKHVACGKELPEHKGPGRPLDYCDERCRWAAANWRRQQERGNSAPVELPPDGGKPEQMIGHSNNYVNTRIRLLTFEDYLISRVDANEISVSTAFKLSARSDGKAGHNKKRLEHGIQPKRRPGRPRKAPRGVAAGEEEVEPEAPSTMLVSTFLLEEMERYLSLVVPGLDGTAKQRGLRLLRSLNAIMAKESTA